MALGTEQTADRTITALVGRMADSFSRLVTQHLQLARMELAEDTRAMGLDAARIAVFVPFVLVGYLFVCGALAAVLATWLGWAGALALVGGLNLAGGGGGIFLAVRRLRTRSVMNDTSEELNRSMAALTTTVSIPQTPATANVLVQQASPAKNPLKEQPNGR